MMKSSGGGAEPREETTQGQGQGRPWQPVEAEAVETGTRNRPWVHLEVTRFAERLGVGSERERSGDQKFLV